MLGVFAEFEANLRRERHLKASPRPKSLAFFKARCTGYDSCPLPLACCWPELTLTCTLPLRETGRRR
jgi:hypothetical protein